MLYLCRMCTVLDSADYFGFPRHNMSYVIQIMNLSALKDRDHQAGHDNWSRPVRYFPSTARQFMTYIYQAGQVDSWSVRITCMICIMFPGLDLYYTDPAQSLTTAGEELDDLDHDLSVLDDLDHDLCLGPERVVASIYQRLRCCCCCCCCCCCWYLRNRSFYPTRFWEKLLRNIYI